MSILIQNVTKQYNGRPVLSGFSAEMQKGRPTAVSGPSGCGKTTLLRIIAGLDTEFTGSISGVPDSLSYLFQENRLLPWKTVSDNIAFVVKDILPKSSITEQTNRLIQLAHLEGHGGKYPHELSGGMQRRTALCRRLSFRLKYYC